MQAMVRRPLVRVELCRAPVRQERGGADYVILWGMRDETIGEAFLAYAAGFPQVEMVVLKIEHTKRVVANALRIMEGEHFPEALRGIGETAAWLHDVGRFSQFTKYQTFSDRVSVNHALLSCGEVLRLGWLDEHSATDRNRILRAIEFHNLKDLPAGMSTEEALLVHLVRDADKLDIFTVLDQAIATDYLPSHPEVYWGLPFAAPPSEGVVQAIEAGRAVDYGEIRSFADFIFIQLAWCSGGLHFMESARIALERNVVKTRCDYLCTLLPGSTNAIGRAGAAAQSALERRVSHGA